jgi:phage-related protein
MNLYFNGGSAAFLGDGSLSGSDRIIVPSQATNMGLAIRVKTMQFGNGYRQDAPDGLNPAARTFKVVFTNRKMPVLTALMNFFRGTGASPYTRRPDEYFFWTPPAPENALAAKWKCFDPSITWNSGVTGTLSATFNEIFDLGVPVLAGTPLVDTSENLFTDAQGNPVLGL